ncbi:hypothetical protein RCOM_0872170 [Ricinus communis]|uniref:Uncharacterized protein n=1 Tax=Ricinus communis TaxID=3988 RepID=B9S6R3_RICCO|nr:hypothetical protein RCOM_0872170 [Ricinus communis]
MANRCHVRSISLPSRSHPATIRIEEELSKLKPLEASSASTLSSLCFDLSGVDGLYHCVNDLLHLASTQQVLSRHQSQKCLNQLIDWSVRLIDACSITRDAMLQFKEQVQALQSALRRRKGDLSIQENICRMREKLSCVRPERPMWYPLFPAIAASSLVSVERASVPRPLCVRRSCSGVWTSRGNPEPVRCKRNSGIRAPFGRHRRRTRSNSAKHCRHRRRAPPPSPPCTAAICHLRPLL